MVLVLVLDIPSSISMQSVSWYPGYKIINKAIKVS